MKVLLVEDDLQLGETLRDVLLDIQYEPTWVRSAEDAQRFLLAEAFDLVLLDVMLPRMSGFDLLKWMRQRPLVVPVIMLTARDAISDRVLGLDSGADDYLPKPFAMEELISRMRAQLRRSGDQRSTIWQIGELLIDSARRIVRVGNTEISLSRREFNILARLAVAAGRVLTRQQLARGSDVEDVQESNAVDVHVYSLRKKLGSDWICTIRGVGYVLDNPKR
jgi:DNA-binding response OmpR family regulator